MMIARTIALEPNTMMQAILTIGLMAGSGWRDPGPTLDAAMKTPGFEAGHWGMLVVDAVTGLPIYEKNPDELFCPASVTKLFSSAAALVDLGADYRFRTRIVRRGEVDGSGSLRGDLILVASGDPSLGGRTGSDGSLVFEDRDHIYANGDDGAGVVGTDPSAGLDSLARGVRGAGIAKVSGDLIVDDRLFEAAPSTGSGPTRVSAIVVNDNLIDVVATPAGAAGQQATIRTIPATPNVLVDARVETTPAGSRSTVSAVGVGPRRIAVRGAVPAGRRPLVRSVEVDDPPSFARGLLIDRLRDRGVLIDASALAENASARLPSREDVSRLPVVAEYASPPLSESIRVILKVSQNLHASALPLLIGAHHGESTLGQGLRREGEILRGLGVDLRAVSFGGGAGGSRSDLASPRATVQLLRSMMGRPDFPAFEAALPILGRDGTLAEVVAPESPARGHVRAKTGTFAVDDALDGRVILTSKALAGLMETAGGRRLVFAVFVNNVPLGPAAESVEATKAAGRLMGRICEILYDEVR